MHSAAVVRFFGHSVVELEQQLRTRDQHGFFENNRPMQMEETKKVESKSLRGEKGKLLRRIRERWMRFFRSLLNAKPDTLDSDIPKKLLQ